MNNLVIYALHVTLVHYDEESQVGWDWRGIWHAG